MTRKTRRVLLMGAVLFLVAANIWWFTRNRHGDQPDFVLGTTLDSLYVPISDLPALPRYDALRSVWREGGRVVPKIADRMRHGSGDDVVTGWQPTSYIVIGMAEAAGPNELRPALVSLARAGICNVAIVQDGIKPAVDRRTEVFIQQIVSVRADNGENLECEARP